MIVLNHFCFELNSRLIVVFCKFRSEWAATHKYDNSTKSFRLMEFGKTHLRWIWCSFQSNWFGMWINVEIWLNPWQFWWELCSTQSSPLLYIQQRAIFFTRTKWAWMQRCECVRYINSMKCKVSNEISCPQWTVSVYFCFGLLLLLSHIYLNLQRHPAHTYYITVNTQKA